MAISYQYLHDLLFPAGPRPGLHPIPGSVPLTLEAAICPPLLYYVALLFLAPAPPEAVDSRTAKALRSTLGFIAGILFFRLPLRYHVPQSIGLTYQLGLVGLYGGCRCMDAFFISPYLFKHVPRRVRYHHLSRTEAPTPFGAELPKTWSDGGVKDPFHATGRPNGSVSAAGPEKPDRGSSGVSSAIPAPARRSSLALLSKTLTGPEPQPVYETATTEDGWPHSFVDRAAWALELELSMRGIGFTWTTADVRHTRKTWLPTVANRVHSILVHVLPVSLVAWVVVRSVYIRYLAQDGDVAWNHRNSEDLFDKRLPLQTQLALTAALGAFLMSAFSLGHSLFAIMLSPLAPSPLAFFPPLYTTPIWDITSVRGFWSYGWHRLFARLFLVYGVWPGEWMERRLTGKAPDQPADVGKVLGGFLSSAFVHSFSVRGVLAGDWRNATGEAKFFALNGLAVVLEGGVQRAVKAYRSRQGRITQMWYDAWVGRLWWIAVLLFTGRNFARGWVKAGLVREMAFM